MERDTARGNRFGRTTPYMKDNGRTIWPTDAAGWFKLTAMSTWDNGRMTSFLATALTCMLMVLLILASGLTTCKTDMGLTNLQTAASIMGNSILTVDTTRTGGNTATARSLGLMDPGFRAILWRITSKERGSLCGPIRNGMKANGEQIRCMGRGYSTGLMVVAMRANTQMIWKKVLDKWSGQMARPTRGNGKTESNKAMACTGTK